MKIFYKFCLIAIFALFLSACSRITQENFDKIQTGMPMAEVIAILGEPSTSQSVDIAGVSGTSATWQNQNAVISIQFLNSKVQVKSFALNQEGSPHDTQSANNS